MVICNEPSCKEWRAQALSGLKFPDNKNHVAQIWVSLAPLLQPDLAVTLAELDGTDVSADMSERLRAGKHLLEGVCTPWLLCSHYIVALHGGWAARPGGLIVVLISGSFSWVDQLLVYTKQRRSCVGAVRHGCLDELPTAWIGLKARKTVVQTVRRWSQRTCGCSCGFHHWLRAASSTHALTVSASGPRQVYKSVCLLGATSRKQPQPLRNIGPAAYEGGIDAVPVALQDVALDSVNQLR
jgi:hypothetical protein